jgi:C_GCAxxG_C_C family probable redox protein
MALKLAAGFGGGMAHKGETCGAVTGAVMLIGLKHGNTKAKDKKARRKTYELVQEFIGQFESRHGSTRCRDLLGHDLSTPEGYDAAKKKKLFRRACPKYVKDAAEIVEQILDSGAA